MHIPGRKIVIFSICSSCRSYYKCTNRGCSVKKQVQRLTKDESMVVTTYEGSHTHPVERPAEEFEHILSQMQIYPLPRN